MPSSREAIEAQDLARRCTAELLYKLQRSHRASRAPKDAMSPWTYSSGRTEADGSVNLAAPPTLALLYLQYHSSSTSCVHHSGGLRRITICVCGGLSPTERPCLWKLPSREQTGERNSKESCKISTSTSRGDGGSQPSAIL